MAMKRGSLWYIPLLVLACLLLLEPVAAQDEGETSQFIPIQSGISLEHPQDWMAVELPDASAVIIVNDPTYLSGDGSLNSGQMRIDIFTPRTIAALIGINADADPIDILQSFAEGAQLPLSDTPLATKIGERRAAQGEIITDPVTTMVYALEVESDAFALIFVTALGDDLEALLPAALDLIETVNLYAVEIENISVDTEALTEKFSEGRFSFRYPEGWFLDPGDENSSLITLTEGQPLDAEGAPAITALVLYAPVPYGTNNLDQYPRQVVETNLALAPGYIDAAERIAFTLNGRPALRVVGDDGELGSIAVAVLIDDVAFAYIFATAAAEDLDRMRESILAIAASFEYTGPDFEAITADVGEELNDSLPFYSGMTNILYPKDWYVEDRNGLLFVSNAVPQDIGQVEASQVSLILAVVRYDAFRNIRDDATPMDILYQIQPVTDLETGIPAYTDFNGQLAARANIEASGLEGMIVVFELDDAHVITFTMYANMGELDEYEALLLSIVTSAYADWSA